MCKCRKCGQCQSAHNALNGRYCDHLGCYVEYNLIPLCHYVVMSNNERRDGCRFQFSYIYSLEIICLPLL